MGGHQYGTLISSTSNAHPRGGHLKKVSNYFFVKCQTLTPIFPNNLAQICDDRQNQSFNNRPWITGKVDKCFKDPAHALLLCVGGCELFFATRKDFRAGIPKWAFPYSGEFCALLFHRSFYRPLLAKKRHCYASRARSDRAVWF